MDKTEILAVARHEPYKGKEFENKEVIRGTTLGYAITLVLGFIIVLVEYFVRGNLHFGMLALGAVSVGVDNLFLGVKLKKFGRIIWGSFMLLLSVIFAIIYIVQAVAT